MIAKLRSVALALAMALALVAVARPARAHGFAPVVLELHEREGGVWDTEIRTTRTHEGAFPTVIFPAQCTVLGGDGPHARARCASLRGEGLGATGLDGRNEILVQAHFLDGSTQTGALRNEGDRFTVARADTPDTSLRAFVVLGARHIFGGLDHLVFVGVLFFFVRSKRMLVAALSAFTIAHSITLGLGAFAIVRVPPLVAETLVALSLVFLAAELAQRRRRKTITARRPWVVAFAFGLLHGSAFTSGLLEAGFDRARTVQGLFGFNVGVELAQLVFVVALAIGVAIVKRIPLARLFARPRLVGYASGAVAMAWTIERVGEMFR